MITLQKYRSLIRLVGDMTRKGEDIQKEFCALGIEDNETGKAFRLLKKIETTLKFTIKEIEVNSDDSAAEGMFGKSNLKGYGDV